MLGLVLSLQEQAQLIAARLHEQVPGSDLSDTEVAEWAQALLTASAGGARLSVVPARPGSPRTTSGHAESEEVWVFSEPGAEPRCDLSVHSRLAFPFMRSFVRLTGEYPEASVFVRILELAGWEAMERDDGSSVGWTLRSMDLRQVRCQS